VICTLSWWKKVWESVIFHTEINLDAVWYVTTKKILEQCDMSQGKFGKAQCVAHKQMFPHYDMSWQKKIEQFDISRPIFFSCAIACPIEWWVW